VKLSAVAVKRTMPDYREIAVAKVVLGARIVGQLDYDYARGAGRARNRTYFILFNGEGYSLTCSALGETLDRHAAVFQRIAESFELLTAP